MGFWDSATVSVDNLARLGPFVDGVVGTDGKYSVLNDAYAAGWRRILLAPGASLSSDLTISAATSIINLGVTMTISGNYKISVAATDCYFEGFRIANNAGVGFYVTANRARFYRMRADYCLSHGIHLYSGTDHELISCFMYGNGGDGVRCEAAATVRMSMVICQSNVGWGINDLSNVAQISGGSVLVANTVGQHNGATTYTDHSVKIT